jgi:hypothetical protein
VVRLVRAGALVQVDAMEPARYAEQVQATRALVRALGQLARALDLPSPSFAPWATALWARDPGPDPWWGWDVGVGIWRSVMTEVAQGAEVHAREASSLILEVTHRVGLSVSGELVEPVPADYGARQTSHGEDTNWRSCYPRGVRDSWWRCLPFSLWYPGFGAASHDVYVSSTVPMGWHWDMAVQAARRVESLGSLEAVMTDSRAWIARKNLKAMASLRHANPPVNIELPEELIAIAADDSARQWSNQDARIWLRTGAAVVSAFPPVGTVVGLVLEGLDLLVEAVGIAAGYWVDPWNRREPVIEVPRLTGTLDTRAPRAPTHVVEAAPAPTPTSTGPLVWMPGAEVAGVTPAPTPVPVVTKKRKAKSKGGAVAAFAVAAAMARAFG